MAAHRARTLRPEDEISHDRIAGPLGAGGMGEVYRARSTRPRDAARSPGAADSNPVH